MLVQSLRPVDAVMTCQQGRLPSEHVVAYVSSCRAQPHVNVTLDTLHLVFSAFGQVQKIATFEKQSGFQALVQYPDAQTAEQVRSAAGHLPAAHPRQHSRVSCLQAHAMCPSAHAASPHRRSYLHAASSQPADMPDLCT